MNQYAVPFVAFKHGVPGRGKVRVRMKLCASVPGQDQREVTLRLLLVACDDPLVVGEDACFVKFVHSVQGLWRGVVVEEVKLVSGQCCAVVSCHCVHSPSQLVKDAQGPVPPDYFLAFKGFKTS